MQDRADKHKTAINHIQRIIGQLKGLEGTISSDSSCTEISTEMYSIMQSMKGLSKKMFMQSVQHSLMKKEFDENELKKMDKLMRLIA